MRTTLLLFCIFSLFSSLSRGSSIPFSPIVRSYSVSNYNAGIQNWSVAQDERGIMYIGNNKGLLEFDGNRWKLHELPTKNIVRAVYIGEDGKISLSIKRANEAKNPPPQPRKNTRFDNDRPPQKKEPLSFEEMMSKYKQSSEEKMSDLRRFMDNKRSR